MGVIDITYRFDLKGNRSEVFELELDDENFELLNKTPKEFPAWVQLDYHKCPHCPLDNARNPQCPAAVSIIDLVGRFENVVSHENVDLEVVTEHRKVSERTSAQRAIGSLLGLLLSTSGCPYTSYFRPMARFHLPLASSEDTLFRATGMYLMAQYFLKSVGKNVDCNLEGLTKIYENVHKLNISLAKRLRDPANADSFINAVIVLDVFTHTMPIGIKEELESLRPLFRSYISDHYLELVGKD